MTEQDRENSLRLREQQQLDLQQNRQSELERILDGILVNGKRPDIDLSQGLQLADTRINEDLAILSTNIDAASNGLAELPQTLFEVTSKLSDLKGITYEMPVNPQTPTTPPSVNVNVTISEAHAWDTAHIQELADKVADQITPEVVNAIGGDSNRY